MPPHKGCTYHLKEMLYVSAFKANFIKFCLLSALFLFAVLISILPFIVKNTRVIVNQRTERYKSDLKYILFWNNPKIKTLKSLRVKRVPEFETGQKVFIEQKCPYYNCYISYNDSFLGGDQSYFDAVVFDVNDVSRFKVNEFNFTRSPHQKFVFRAHESSEKHPICNPIFDDFFNWTWSYKLDSDIPHPFINIADSNNNIIGPKLNIDWIENMNHTVSMKNKISDKTKAVAWIVPKCKLKNKHMDFVKDLRKELKSYNLTVDLFGSCGDMKCGALNKCMKTLEKNYYFQMVLEDSITEDYLTAKVVKPFHHFILSIFFSGANYTRFLPPASYIDARAYDMKKLGAMINYLIQKPEVYQYFFDWKRYYSCTMRQRTDICDLCKKLNEHNLEYSNHVKFRTWWNKDYNDICERIFLYDLFN